MSNDSFDYDKTLHNISFMKKKKYKLNTAISEDEVSTLSLKSHVLVSDSEIVRIFRGLLFQSKPSSATVGFNVTVMIVIKITNISIPETTRNKCYCYTSLL